MTTPSAPGQGQGPLNQEGDALDALLRSARPEAPAGLPGRVLAAVQRERSAQAIYWSEFTRWGRRALLAAAACLVVSVGAVGYALSQSTPAVTAPASNTETGELVPMTGPQYWLFDATLE
jgi:hypothetical protein